MTLASYLLSVVSAIGVLALIVEMLRRRKIRERHAFWWLILGLLGLVVSLVPWVLEEAARLLGIEVPANLAFFISIATLFLVSLHTSAEITKLEDRVRTLAERDALNSQKIKHLELQVNSRE